MLHRNCSDFWITQIDLPLDAIHAFLASGEERRSGTFDVLEYKPFEIADCYREHLSEPPKRKYYGALYYRPDAAPTKTLAIGNAGSWGTLSNYLCKKLSARNYQFNLNNDSRCTFRVHENGKQIRAVIALLEDNNKWQFTEVGSPLPFEDLAHYRKRKNREKLTTPILETYCEKLGLPMNDEALYQSTLPAIFVKHAWGEPIVGTSHG